MLYLIVILQPTSGSVMRWTEVSVVSADPRERRKNRSPVCSFILNVAVAALTEWNLSLFTQPGEDDGASLHDDIQGNS